VTSLLIRHDGRERGLGPGDFPVPLGGPGSAVPVAAAAGPLAWLGLESGEVFVQPSPGANVRCNGARLSASHWLRDGDVLRLSSTSVEVRMRGDALELGVTLDGEANPTEPPVVLVPPPRGGVPADDHDDVVLSPIPYVPRPIGRAAPPPRRSLKWLVPVAAALVLAAGAVLLLSRLALVEIVVEPAPDSVALVGPWPVATLGPRVLAITGGYTLVAEKAGYRRLEQAVVVERGAVLRHALQPLPGRLAVETPGLAGAEVSVDGAARGTTPLAAFEVDAGERELAVRAPGYQDHRQRVAVAGRGALQSIVVTLAPLPTPPPGPPPPPRPGIVVVSSDPAGARVSLDGADSGRAPLELRVGAGKPVVVRASLPGHASAELSLTLRAGERREATLRLVPQLGEVKVTVRPPDAELVVDGQPRGKADQTLQLVAVPHQVELRREGYETARVSVTPRPGFPQTISLALKSADEAREEQMPRVARSPEGHELRLVEGRRISMGAPRREPGRRANEQQRDVELARPFYVATREVSNEQFRRYLAPHSSGSLSDQSLDMDAMPVVNVTWQQAAAYCNWLSDRERLPRAYVERDGTYAPIVPLNTGYRLPTEAEWERVARYPGAQGPLKYPWGSALPVPPGAGNYADASAAALVARVLDGYDDGFKASAPVESFAANALGLLHLGDNVAEWTHDWYTLTPSIVGQPARDPVGPAQGEYHVIRGASFLHGTVTELRLSFRDYGKDARPDVGFRIARYAQ
jgi:formylglycine-generating enzyme required for sulfatase activity